MTEKSLGTYKDNIIGVNYDLTIVESAKELSTELKATLEANKIDYKLYNSGCDQESFTSNPPRELYEYQPFFLLKRTNGDIVLLDGFRRLLWYDAPGTPILVRTYKEKDLNSQQILTLLVNLNHFKFFGGHAYHERGFSLLLKTIFDIDITKFRTTFDAYLSSKTTKNSYSDYNRLEGQQKNEEIKDRIINKFFISDIKFLQTLNESSYLCNKYMGALLYELRTKSTKEFDVDRFIALIKENKVLCELMGKFKKIGTDHSVKSQEVVNKIIEMYRNIFILMEGGKVEKSFAEQQKECKELVTKLKKDKSLTKMTGASKIYEIEKEIEKRIRNKEDVKFVCVVHPRDESDFHNYTDKETIRIPYGLLMDVQFLKFVQKRDGFGTIEMNIGIIKENNEYRFTHNYRGFMDGYGKKYTELMMNIGRYDIDLFVCIPSKEFQK
jgi:hypothetical protein